MTKRWTLTFIQHGEHVGLIDRFDVKSISLIVICINDRDLNFIKWIIIFPGFVILYIRWSYYYYFFFCIYVFLDPSLNSYVLAVIWI